ncbi:MAG: oligosaccharide flippase family protein [Lachnospiraceae bacterium]|nr:oligosaccharide flippase family protein [Lachnospiraceae bacterium]
MSRQKDLMKNTAILTFGKICTQCVSFFLLPLYTAILDTYDYGTFDLIITYCTLLLPIVSGQLDQGIFRFLIECRDDEKKQINLFSSVFAAEIILSLLYASVLGVFSIVGNFKYGIFMMLYVVLHIFMALLMQFARGLGNDKIYAMASFISASMTVFFNVITLVIMEMKLKGLFVANITAQAATIIYLCVVVKPWNYLKIKCVNIKTLKSLAKYSVPLIPNELSWWVVNVSDRTIVSYILGVSVNGIYTVANKFSNMFISFYNVFNLSWTETVALHYYDYDRNDFLSKTMEVMFNMFSCACFIGVSSMPFIFPIMVDERYSAAYNQIIILFYAMLLRIVVGLYSAIYVAVKDTKKIAYTSAMAAMVNIIVNLLLIHRMELYAASISSMAAFGAMAIIRVIDIKRKVNIGISRKIFCLNIAMAITLAATYYINNTLLNIVMFIVVCIYTIVVNRNALNYIK